MWVQWGGGGETADLNVVLLHISHVFHIEQVTFVQVQQHHVLLFWSPQIPLLQKFYKVFPIISKDICINVSRLCGLSHVPRGSSFTPSVFYSCSLAKNHGGGDNHSPCADVCHHCTGLPFTSSYSLKGSFSLDSNNFL